MLPCYKVRTMWALALLAFGVVLAAAIIMGMGTLLYIIARWSGLPEYIAVAIVALIAEIVGYVHAVKVKDK